MNPTDLPNAMAFAQEMESNNMRAKFAHNFVGMSYKNYNSNYSNGPEQNNNSFNQKTTNNNSSNYLRYNQRSPQEVKNNQYTKLNENTIPDRYPMQDPSVILANLGKATFFSTIDL